MQMCMRDSMWKHTKILSCEEIFEGARSAEAPQYVGPAEAYYIAAHNSPRAITLRQLPHNHQAEHPAEDQPLPST
jgi:hypothetical protein